LFEAVAHPTSARETHVLRAILNNFSKEKIGYIRNTLFAKKGYKFKNPKYANYFSQKSWYRGIYDSDELLNPDEKRFVLILKERE